MPAIFEPGLQEASEVSRGREGLEEAPEVSHPDALSGHGPKQAWDLLLEGTGVGVSTSMPEPI